MKAIPAEKQTTETIIEILMVFSTNSTKYIRFYHSIGLSVCSGKSA